MRAIDRKMLRDLWHLRGQVVAIALVVASGVAVLIMSQSTQRSLLDTTAAYYERYAFADVFAHLTRAPERLAERIGAIDGVQAVQTRIVRYAMIDIPDFAEPVMGQFVSIPEDAQPRLNKLALRSGRLVQANRVDEVVVSEHFAEEHGLAPGSTLIAILNGNRRELDVVGIALSPEFIYSLGPGALMPDEKRFGIVWMGREALAGAFDLQESFNNVSLTLLRDASPEAVIQQLDVLLERYGGIGAVARKDQLSNWFVENEIQQLETISRLLPVIFLAVSAALTNMVLSRLIATERSQIGLMKAFGYSNVAVGWHYTKLVMVIAVLGALIGLVAGGFVGRLNTEMYAENFRFPFLYYRPSGAAFVVAAGLSVLAAVAGAAGSVFRAVRLPPAQAMLPPAPPLYRRGRLTESRVGRWLDQPTRIVLRNIARQPFRSAMTLAGVACCIALLIMALQWNDSLGYLARHHYYDVQHQHVTVGLTVPQEITVVQELGRMPAVQAAEAMRIVSVDLYAGHVAHRGAVTGVSDDAQLQPIYDDRSGGALPPPPEGIVLGSRLARKLGVAVGDRIWMHVLEGRRPWLQVTVASLVEVYIGVPAYMRLSTLNRLLRDRPKTEYVHLLVDPAEEGRLYRRLKTSPMLSSIALRQAGIDSFNDTVVRNLMIFITIYSIFACALGFGVAYNAARIGLSERGRELATLRVLGFTRGEIAYILLAELALLVVLAVPVGCLLGVGLTRLIASAFDTELFRVPAIIEAPSYGLAIVIALAAAVAAAVVVQRRITGLDLIGVLKTRE